MSIFSVLPRYIFLLVAMVHASFVLADSDIFVAPTGNDAWSGRLAAPNATGDDGPLASLAGARDQVRALKANGPLTEPVNVYLRGGTYTLDAPVVFLPEDSGTESAPIRYRAYSEEVPVLSGGLIVTDWRQEGDFWVADIPDGAPKNFHELWVGDKRRTPARTPNAAHEGGDEPPDTDFFYTAGPVMVKDKDGKDVKSNQAFKFRKGDIQPWDSLNSNAIVVAFNSWTTSLMRVQSVDWENQVVEFTGPSRYPFCRWQTDQRYYIEHLFEALDAPGEWYANHEAGKLFYVPLPGETLEGFQATIPQTDQLILLQGDPASQQFVEHLQFSGLDLRHCEFPIAPEGHSDAQAAVKVNAAVEITGARYCTLEDSRIANVGTYGVWLRAGSQHITLRRNELTDLGAGGVRIGEVVSPETAAHAADYNVVDNNYLHDGGRVWREAVGVWIGRASHNDVTHNEIADFRYTGVSVGWSWGYQPSSAHHNRINNNYIHHIGRGQLNDMGGVYLLGVSPGTEVKNNLVHDVISHPRLYGGWGLYTDEGSTDIVLENNVVYNTRTGGFHQHYGKDNRVVNNVFAFSHTPNIIRTRNEDHNSFFFERNIVYFNNGQLLGSNWQNNNFTLDHNIYWDTSGRPVMFKDKTFTEWQAAGHDRHSVIANPGFVDAEAGDFTLRADSPALALGFQPIDLGQVGLYGEDAWVNKPKGMARPPFVPPLPKKPELLSTTRIWDEGNHNAFTDIIRHDGYFYVTFREAENHVPSDGAIRVIRSKDGAAWESCGYLTEESIDLRDPKISVMPDKRLMLVMGGSDYEGKELVGRQPRVAFSKNGTDWSAPQRVCSEGDWLWRVTWHEGKAWGVSNHYIIGEDKPRSLLLYESDDGVNFKIRTALDITGNRFEVTARFLPDDTMMLLARREESDKGAYIGTSLPPYTDWNWSNTGIRVGGPDFIRLPDGTMWAGYRNYVKKATTELAYMTETNLKPVLTLPSGGDTSYPGFVWHDDVLWMTYYSSHEEKTAIYLAKIKFQE